MGALKGGPAIRAEVICDPTVMSGDPVVRGTRGSFARGNLSGLSEPAGRRDRCRRPLGRGDLRAAVAIHRAAGRRPLKERFLIDECLSGRLVAAAKARGFQADFRPPTLVVDARVRPRA